MAESGKANFMIKNIDKESSSESFESIERREQYQQFNPGQIKSIKHRSNSYKRSILNNTLKNLSTQSKNNKSISKTRLMKIKEEKESS